MRTVIIGGCPRLDFKFTTDKTKLRYFPSRLHGCCSQGKISGKIKFFQVREK